MPHVQVENLTKVYGKGSAKNYVYVFPYSGPLAAIAIGLIFGVLAALVPARQAARMEIVHALRYE